MVRDSLIRRWQESARRHGGDGACALVFIALLMLGAGRVASGAGKFAESLLPGSPAQADAQPARLGVGVARLPMFEFSGPSRYAPQVLFPVQSHVFPDWLQERLRAGASAAPVTESFHGLPPGSVKPVMAIVIDDLGEDIAGTDRATALPQQVALSFLPYAETTAFLAQEAARKGHDILAHVPMEAQGRTDPGPMALRVGAPDIVARLAWNLARVPGLVGINNHEGSKFTADAAALAPVAEALAARHLFFFDSRTIADSKVVTVAHLFGVQSAGRDIFLDDAPGEAEVRRQLDALAARARAAGVAIAIGHPHDATLKVLKEWLAQDHGVELVRLPDAMRRKTRAVALAAR